MLRKYKTELLMALSAANVLYLAEWRLFIYPRNTLLITAPNYGWGLLTLLFGIFLTSFVLFLMLVKIENYVKPKIRTSGYLLMLGLLAFPINVVRTTNSLSIKYPVLSSSFWTQTLGTLGAIVVFGTLLSSIVYLCLRNEKPVVKTVRNTYLFLLSFAIVTLGQAAGEGVRLIVLEFQAKPVVYQAKPPERPRMVVQIFDELSMEYIEPATRGNLLLPELDRLRSESMVATNATAPGIITRVSIPSYLAGQRIPDHRDLTQERYDGSYFNPARTFEIQAHGNLFKDLRELGYRSALVGWYIPYCRHYGAYLDHCTNFSYSDYDFHPSVAENLFHLFNRTFRLVERSYASVYHRIVKEAEAVLTDTTYDLVFLHWPVPHLPGIYDSQDRIRMVENGNSEEAYRNNIRLVDRTLGFVRNTLEAAGQWDDSLNVLVSDHPVHNYRDWVQGRQETYDKRIPFIVRLPHRTKTGTLETPLNSLALHDIVLAFAHNDAEKLHSLLGIDLATAKLSLY